MEVSNMVTSEKEFEALIQDPKRLKEIFADPVARAEVERLYREHLADAANVRSDGEPTDEVYLAEFLYSTRQRS